MHKMDYKNINAYTRIYFETYRRYFEIDLSIYMKINSNKYALSESLTYIKSA